MEAGATAEQFSRKLWLLGHSYPAQWVHELAEPLDPRHPTRHNIWTPVLDRIQERVYAEGHRLRVDMERCYVCNAAAKQSPQCNPDWDWRGTSIPARVELLCRLLTDYRPPVLITFGADAYRFATLALRQADAPRLRLKAAELGERFRHAVRTWNSGSVNVIPLLHAYVARSGWLTAGSDYSGTKDATINYFDYVGRAIGDVLLTHGRQLPIWCD